MSDLNGKQFRQQRLFAPLGMTKKPHQQTPLEFANSPRTMWHASHSEDFEEIRNSSDQFGDEGGTGQGFHMGTLNAAHERATRGHLANETQGYLHPVRVDRQDFLNTPDEPIEDMGTAWSDVSKPAFYRNEFEDEGSISAVTSDPYQARHQADYVHDALDRGGIPSGAAEYHATRLDTEHTEHSPGFPRSRFEAEKVGEGTAYGTPRRLRAREDAYQSPVSKFEQSMPARYRVGAAAKPEQLEMEFPGYQDSHTFMKRQRGEYKR